MTRLLKVGVALMFISIAWLPAQAKEIDNSWVAKSDANAQLVLNILARFSPEGAASLGVDGLDEEIFDLNKNIYERSNKAVREVIKDLNKRLDKEEHPIVQQDLQILIGSLQDNLISSELDRKHMLPYFNLNQTIFQGTRGLINPQIPKERYSAIITRLKRYAGMERGYTPITELAIARTKERLKIKGLKGPYKDEIEQDLENAPTFIKGMEKMLAGSGLDGWQEPFKKLTAQLADYNEWVTKEIVPRAREDFRLPAEMYQDALKNWGVNAAPEDLIQAATAGYMDIRNEMVALAPLVARQKGYDSNDYRDVIRNLKKERINGDALLPYYRNILGKLETIIRDHGLVSLPDRDAGIRVGSEAETAAQPAAHLDIPRLIGNTGEFPEFILPMIKQKADGTWPESDDTYEAGTWTLTAHEARPGHELQFSSMLESGVSITRAIFAFNSANVEGWALYAEAIAKPYMPLEAQLISLQYRLARAARMFLDPMLNLGKISETDAKQLLTDDVVLGETWAQNEIERYTYRMPGQATAYYFGYNNLQALRTQTELALRDNFDAKSFHDFILSQGLLPPEILRQAVMNVYVPSRTSAAAAAP